MSIFRINSNVGKNSEKTRIQNKINECDKEISAFSSEITQQEADKTTTRADSNSTQSAMTQAQDNVNNAQSAISSSTSQISSAQSSIASAESAISSANSIPGEPIKDEEGNVIGMDFSKRDAAVAEAQSQFAEAQTQFAEAQLQLEQAQAQLEQAQAQQQKTASDYQNMLDELEAIEAELDNLNSDMDFSERDKNRLENELKVAESKEKEENANNNTIDNESYTSLGLSLSPPPPPNPNPTRPMCFDDTDDKATIENESLVPPGKSAQEVMKNTSVGDVFELPNQKNVFIKIGDNEYKQLDISKETYNKLFKENHSSKSTNSLYDKFSMDKSYWSKLYQTDISQTVSDLFTNPRTKQDLLSCFSEDEEGNITVKIPNSNTTFSINSNDDIKNYDNSNVLADNNLGTQMFQVAFSSFLNTEKAKYNIQKIDKNLEEKTPCSEEMASKVKNIVKSLNEKDIEDPASLIDYYFICEENDMPTDDIKEQVGNEIFKLFEELPKDEIKNGNIDYAVKFAEKEELILELELAENNKKFDFSNLSKVDKINILSQFGLNSDLEKINEKSYAIAEEYIKSQNYDENISFNKNSLAAHINNNENNIKITEKLTEKEDLNYSVDSILTYFKETEKEDADIEFLLESIDLNWDPRGMFSVGLTPDNIDLAKFFKETYGEDKQASDFKTIVDANKILSEEKLIEYMENIPLDEIKKTTNEIFSIIPNFKDDGTTRSELLKSEAEKIYLSEMTGENINDLTVPTYSSDRKGLKESEIGDIYEVEGEKFIYIKTDDKESKQLNITKETYNELFPALQRYMSEQGEIGDCYLVSMLNNIMTTPEQRDVLLSCFSEDEKGNVTVDLQNGNYSFTLEKGKEMSDYEDPKLLSDSSKGMQMLELCYGLTLKSKGIETAIDSLFDVQKKLKTEEFEKYSSVEESQFTELAKFLLENTTFKDKSEVAYIISEFDNLDNSKLKLQCLYDIIPNVDSNIVEDIYNFLEEDNTSDNYLSLIIEQCIKRDRIQDIENDPYGTILRNDGGTLKEVYKCFGIETSTRFLKGTPSSNLKGFAEFAKKKNQLIQDLLPVQVSELLKDPNIQIVAGGTIGESDSFYLNRELNIAGNHAYTIYPKQQENGEWLFEVINPWDEASTSILTTEQFEEYFSHVEYIIKEEKDDKESFWEKLFN